MMTKAITYVCNHPVKKNTESLSVGRLRVFCMQGNGCKYATAFPIPVAMYIMKTQSERLGKPIIVIDPCAGWGDRLAAAMILGKKYVESYTCFDPWEVSNKVCADIHNKLSLCGIGKGVKITIQTACSEKQWKTKDRRKAHLIFTSPPYADLEQYGCDTDEPAQAWKYCSKNDRIASFGENFLLPMLMHARDKLTMHGGRIAININDIPGIKKPQHNLVETFLLCAKKAGLYVDNVVGMSLSVRAPKTTFAHASAVYRAEPIFILAKCDSFYDR